MSCDCNPCDDAACDPNNEPLASALDNFITQFFGTLQKTCVNDAVTWILPCDLSTGNPIFPRNAGEGIACYLLRLYNTIQTLNISCLDFRDKIILNGGCYTTWQEAYDANSTVAVPSAMVVGTSASFGDLTLAANYNSNIIIFGLGEGASTLGNILSARFDVVLDAHHVTIGSIDTRTAGIGGATVTLTGNATVGVIDNSRNDVGAGSVGTVTATNWDITSIDNSHSVGVGAAGNVVLTECICGNINTSAVGTNPGAITLRNCRSIGSIINTGSALNSANTVIAHDTNIISSAGLVAIAVAGGGSSFINAKIKTIDTNQNAINHVELDGPQFINTLIVPHGTGIPINASLARTIIAYNLLTKNDISPNVTLSEGNYQFSPNIIYP